MKTYLRSSQSILAVLAVAIIGITLLNIQTVSAYMSGMSGGHSTESPIMNGSFESFTGKDGWTITQNVMGWTGVDAGSVTKTTVVNPTTLPRSEGIEIWRNFGKKPLDGVNQIELDGHKKIVDGVYQTFMTTEATNLMFTAYARKAGTSDIEVYINGAYIETVTPPTMSGKAAARQAYFYPLEPGMHSIMFKEVNEQDNAHGAVIDEVKTVSDMHKAMLDSAGRHTHNFYEHVSDLYEMSLLAANQTEYNTAELTRVSSSLYEGTSPITGLVPVIEEAVATELAKHKRLTGEALERKVANRLTNLNDFEKLKSATQDKLIAMTGINFQAMSKADREKSINHLLHSPIPFGAIDAVLTPEATIDLGYTHTLDKNWTRVAHQGNGVWKVWIISNNNNGSHTGHNLGEFTVQLWDGATPEVAKAVANDMITNTNNNNKLGLDAAARAMLYAIAPERDPTPSVTPFNNGIANNSFESFYGENGWTITRDIPSWYGVDASSVTKNATVDPDTLPRSMGIEIWRNKGRKSDFGVNQIELDGHKNIVDGVYQKFSTDTDTNIMISAYARQVNTSDIEVYIDGRYVETITPPLMDSKGALRGTFYYPIAAGEHSLLLKEVNAQDSAHGAIIDVIQLVKNLPTAVNPVSDPEPTPEVTAAVRTVTTPTMSTKTTAIKAVNDPEPAEETTVMSTMDTVSSPKTTIKAASDQPTAQPSAPATQPTPTPEPVVATPATTPVAPAFSAVSS